MIANLDPKVNSAGWGVPPAPPCVTAAAGHDSDDQPNRYVRWGGVFDRPIPRRWRGGELADANWWPTYDDQTRFAFLEAAHWLIDAPLTELRRTAAAPDPLYHQGHVMAAAVLLLTRDFSPINLSPATWIMRIREWRDNHLGLVDSDTPPLPWIDDQSSACSIYCIAAIHVIAMAADTVFFGSEAV